MLSLSEDSLSARAVFAAFIILAAWATSLFFSGYRDILYAPAILLLLFAAGVAVIPALKRGAAIPSSPAALLLFALWLYVTFSLTWTTVPFASLVTWIVFISLPLGFFAFTVPADARALLNAAVPALLLGLAILAAWAIAQVTLFRAAYGTHAAWPMVNPNNLAALLGLGLLPALALCLQRNKFATVVTAIMFAGMLATQSRGGFLCVLAAAAVLCFILRETLDKKYLLKLLAAGAVIFVLMQLPAQTPLTTRLLALGGHDPDVLDRLALWKSTLKMIAAHPWGGTGLGTFYLYYPPFRSPADNSSGSWAHSDPLQFWAETGLAAPLLLYALLLAVALRTIKALRWAEAGSEERTAIAGLVCGLLALALHIHIEFDLYLMPTLIVAGIWLAALHALTGDALTDGEDSYAPLNLTGGRRAILAGAILCSIALIALPALSSAAGQIYRTRAQDAINHGNIGVFLDNIGKAGRFAPGSFVDPAVQLAGFYVDMLQKPGVYFTADDRKTMFDSARGLLDGAEKLNPAWSEIDRKRAKLYDEATPDLMPDGRDQALIAWGVAIAKNPLDFRARQELALALLARGQAAAAQGVLANGLVYPHDDNVTAAYNDALAKIAPLARLQRQYREEKQP